MWDESNVPIRVPQTLLPQQNVSSREMLLRRKVERGRVTYICRCSTYLVCMLAHGALTGDRRAVQRSGDERLDD